MFRRFFIFVWEVVKVVAISLAIILPVRYYLIQAFYVKGASMEPNFHDREYLIVDEITYRFREPQRGEIVVFRYPIHPQEYFIKRIIALPGESVKIQDGHIFVYNDDNKNGMELKEKYIPEGIKTYSRDESTIKLGDDEYFVLGDNRNFSKDSRSFGPIDKSFLIGKVLFRGWPLDKVTLFNKTTLPQY